MALFATLMQTFWLLVGVLAPCVLLDNPWFESDTATVERYRQQGHDLLP